jgi:hypothetical protein
MNSVHFNKNLRIIFFAGLSLLTGCLSRPHLEKESFRFELPARTAEAGAHGSRVLRVRSLQVSPPFDGRALVYRTGEFSYERDSYAEFLVTPAEGLLAPVCGRWRNDGPFDAVSEAGSALKPDTLVEIQVSQLYGDFRPTGSASAVLAVRFVFFDAPKGVPGRAILQQEYSRSIPMEARNPAALIKGWNQALAEILDAAALDFGRAAEGAK